MATSLHIGPVLIPIGPQAFEITSPARANGAKIRIERFTWPIGPLVNYRIYERQRNGDLLLLTQGAEEGGPVIGKNGEINPPLRISLNWAADADKDVIRIEVDAIQPFTAEAFLDFV